ncbi:MAG: MBL fold metallo-hydrolase [Lachnospiraceae bacterium]|nr:MBL fold metallo-hydrolase [Lachnospiraceae bacterium]
MKIVNLIENTEGTAGCISAHGLSFYIETEKHRILCDLGPSEDTLKNAALLGIDLKSVDTVILSHGHYDHSGGIIPFSKVNDTALIYMQKSAADDYYADDGEAAEGDRYRYIGIDKEITKLPQLRTVDGDYVIDDELSLFVMEETGRLPFTNVRLKRRENSGYVQDDFRHEQFLVIREKDRNVLLSGCAHNGILNIVNEYNRKYGSDPDMVISGFHLMKKTDYKEHQIREITDTAEELARHDTVFYTCHCTGIPAYEIMKEVMGDKLRYVHSGDKI